MKPKRIIILRHGQSEGNVDKTLYKSKPDYALDLTDLGKQQAFEAGQKIKQIIGDESAFFYVSPYFRTRRTYQHVTRSIVPAGFYEDARLREQEWSRTLRKEDVDYNALEDERDSYGHFYFGFSNGESCANVYDRVSDVVGTINRDFEKPNYPENAIIVGHGRTNRLFLMRWFHYSVEELELLRNPHNCEFWIMELNKNNKYELITELRKYDDLTHEYKFDWKTM